MHGCAVVQPHFRTRRRAPESTASAFFARGAARAHATALSGSSTTAGRGSLQQSGFRLVLGGYAKRVAPIACTNRRSPLHNFRRAPSVCAPSQKGWCLRIDAHSDQQGWQLPRSLVQWLAAVRPHQRLVPGCGRFAPGVASDALRDRADAADVVDESRVLERPRSSVGAGGGQSRFRCQLVVQLE